MVKLSLTHEQFVKLHELCNHRMTELDNIRRKAEGLDKAVMVEWCNEEQEELRDMMQDLFGKDVYRP